MKRTFSIALVALGVFAVPAAADHRPGHTQGGGNNSQITVKASATTVTFGQTVTFTGNVKDAPVGTIVEVWENPQPYTGGFKNTGRTAATTDAQGSYRVTGVKPQRHTQYKVVARTTPPVESGNVLVQVRLRVSFRVSDSTPRRGQLVRFYGTVAPEHDGKTVLIQRRRTDGKWATVARTTTLDNGTATSKYSRRIRIRRSGTFRVSVPDADGAHLSGVSRTRTLRTHG